MQQILVMPDAPALLPHLRPKDELVVRVESIDRVPSLAEELKHRSVKINSIVVPIGPLAAFLRTRANQVSGATDYALVLEASEAGEFAPLMRWAHVLASDNIRVKLPLRNARDLQAIKILTSLQVRVVVDVTDDDLDWDLAEEAVVEAILSPVTRGSLDPFTMLAAMIANLDERFSLGSVYFDDGKDYVQVDGEGKAYASRRAMRAGTPLDVELSERDDVEDCLGCPKKSRSRDELRELSGCAFCEGYRYCKGYLKGLGPDERCRRLFVHLAEAAQAQPTRPKGAGRGK